MRKPYQKDKKRGRIGGNPLDNVVGEAAGVQGQKVQPGKGGTMQGTTQTVKVGGSSSYNVSSGLVNALDVVQGIGNVMQGAEKLGNQIDDARLMEMKKKIAEAQSSEEWTNPESEGYLNDEDKLKTIGGIQKEYEGGWLNDRYRAQYESEVAHNNIATQNLDFAGDMAWAQRSRATQLSMGVPVAEAQANTDKLYESILAKHGKDAMKGEQIKGAQLADAAQWATAVSEGAQNTVAAWQAAGGLTELHSSLPPQVGYEQWEQTALAAMAQYGGGEGSAALWESYNKDTGKFEGPYADMLSQTLRRTLEPVYNKSVEMQVADSQLQQQHAITQAPQISAVEYSSATDRSVGHQRVGDGFARMMATVQGGQRSLSDTQRRPFLGKYLGDVSTLAFRMDATMTNDEATDMMNAAVIQEADKIAAFVGMDKDSEEFAKYLDDQVKIGMSTFKVARQAASDEQNDTAEFFLEQGKPSFDPAVVKENINADLFGKAIRENGTVEMGLINAANGEKFGASDPRALAFGKLGLNFITAANWAQDPKVRMEAQRQFREVYQDYINDPEAKIGPLVSLLTKAAKDTGWEIRIPDGEGSIQFSMNAEAREDPATLGKARIGAMLPYLQTDKDGYFTSTGNPEIIMSTLKGLVTAGAMTDNERLNPEFVKQTMGVATASMAMFPGDSGTGIGADVILDGLTAIGGESLETNRKNLRYSLATALENEDANAVAQIMDGIIAGRAGIVLERDSEFKTMKQFDPAVSQMIGAASLLSADGDVASEGAMAALNPLDWFGDFTGMDADVATNRGTMIGNEASAQRLMDAGIKAGVFRYDPESNLVTLTDPEAEKNGLAMKINKQLENEGRQWRYHRNEEGVVTSIDIIDTPPVYFGDGLASQRPDENFGGDFDHAMGAAFELESWNESQIDDAAAMSYNGGGAYGAPSVGSYMLGGIVDWWRQDTDTGATSRFYDLQQKHIQSTGRSQAEATALLRDPDFRRQLADSGRQARRFFLGGNDGANQGEREAMANQIDETIKSFSDLGLIPGPNAMGSLEHMDNIQEVRDIANALRAGTLRGDHPIWKDVTRIAAEQGYDSAAVNPPVHAFKIALMSWIVSPHLQDAVEHTSIYDIQPTRGFSYGLATEEDRETQRGWDRAVRFNVDNFHWVGQDLGNVNIPLFATSQVGDKSKGDPRTLMNTESNRIIRQGRSVAPGQEENKYDQVHSPDAVSARTSGTSHRREGGTGSTWRNQPEQ